MTQNVRYDVSLLSDDDLFLFNEGSHFRLYLKLGAHPLTAGDTPGTYFAVWAPDAEKVFVIGDFNNWDKESHPLVPRGQSGIWDGFIPGVGPGAIYKFHIHSRFQSYKVDKADVFGYSFEGPPRTASVVWDLDYAWSDQDWMTKRHEQNALNAPLSIYEVHLGSWRLLGLPDHRLLRPHQPLWHSPGFYVSGGLSAPA
jgi:1,4-alpha-glucan branching enzyme